MITWLHQINYLTIKQKLGKILPHLPDHHPLLIFIIFLLGVFVRAYKLGNYPLGFDQVQILQNAELILNGKMMLLGPRTGPAEMFTGPLIYYLHAISLALIQSPLSIAIGTLVISITTGLVLTYFAHKLINKSGTLLMMALWAFSPFLISLDRIPWNPNLSILAASLVFFPLLQIVRRKSYTRIDLLFIFLGCFLGYQAHFSGLFIPFLLIVIWFLFIRKNSKLIVSGILGFAASVFPTIVFDIRNNWLNVNGLISLLQNHEALSIYQLYQRIIEKFIISLENIGKIIFNSNTQELIVITGLSIVLVNVYILWRTKSPAIIVSIAWILLISLIFALYRRTTPEYYFLIQIPAILMLYINIFEKLKIKSIILFPIILLFASYSLLLIVSSQSQIPALSITNQQNISKHLQQVSAGTYDLDINFNMKPVDNEGLRYLIHKEGLPLSSNKSQLIKKVQLTYPFPKISSYIDANYHGVAVWVDSRSNMRNYLINEEFIIEYTKDIELLRSYSIFGFEDIRHQYRVIREGQVTADIYAFHQDINYADLPLEIKEILNTDKQLLPRWKKFSNDTNFPFSYWQKLRNRIFIYTTTEETFMNVSIEVNLI